MSKKSISKSKKLVSIFAVVAILGAAYFGIDVNNTPIVGDLLGGGTQVEESIDNSGNQSENAGSSVQADLGNIPEFDGETAYVNLNGGKASFTKDEITTTSFETYSELDNLGRCGVTMACVGQDIMPTEDRGSISSVKPSGWQSVKYDHVEGKYLYNRCHLIGHQLTGEDANKSNLVTGTRYLNIEGMLPFENLVAEYVKDTGNHVMYRVVPIFEGDELVPRGVTMEGYSVEDNGAGVNFNVYCYNNQPGVVIDYATGLSELE